MPRLIPLLLAACFMLATAGASSPLAALQEQQLCTGEGVTVSTSLPVSNLFLQGASETTWGVADRHRDALDFFNSTCSVRTHLVIDVSRRGKGLAYTVQLQLLKQQDVIWSASTRGMVRSLGDLEGQLSDLVELGFQQLVTAWQASH
ncbi:hypothetical protein GO986_01485 [Deinococcus sp. HMF7620]|uniref:Uncharacterized protein n=1 Tax=Deinococcus arboris TaxID=2682977 RepID=A0A7C9LL68_9DEIO|nr:hypothetical protein [Deinococcus arboris]MVN85436.1 hypothetical protein [Deinococcus arboris]